MKFFNRFRRDERGIVFAQVAALVAAPIIVTMIALSAISVIRTGSGLTDTMQRRAVAQSVFDDFQRSIGSASSGTVQGPKKLTVVNPSPASSSVPAFQMSLPYVAGSADVCSRTVWELVTDGANQKLRRTISIYSTAACNSAIASTIVTELGGLSSATKFVFSNTAGRPLTVSASGVTSFVAGTSTKPAATVPNALWNDTAPGIVQIDGAMNKMIGSSAISVSARFPIRGY